jgi:thioredoxin reductase/ferredoxin
VTWVVPLALGGFAIFLMAFFTVLGARKKHKQVVTPAATVGPRILVHDINDDRCTGCDACVAVCPTNVLDLVANKSRVLRFEDCIQCEACMFACPTEALVMFPEGSVPPPLKVPEIDENFQTMVPGQYLIGEVAGKPLVKNAANLGRAVIEHMLMTGMRPGALGQAPGSVDVAIVGSGPGGLSAALSCIQRGLSFVVLEKEQMIASTILRYPRGKLVMAEPYDTQNLSLLPVFDAAKEQLIPIWQELLQRLGLRVNQGESVETIGRGPDGAFEVRSTVAAYRAQRTILSIGTRGKPRTLQVPGENLPKIFSLLDDPDEFRGRAVLVVGGGDSAVEAALALSDAGAKVMISYRGKGFNRAAPKNKQTIEAYAAEGRIKAKLGSQVLQFDPESVTLAMSDGSQKRYANDATFVLIGADPPIAWLEKMGVRFVERPHQHQMGKTDDVVRRYVQRAVDCPEDAARAAAQILGGSMGIEPPQGYPSIPSLSPPHGLPQAAQMVALGGGGNEVSGPRKWLRSATSIFSTKGGTGVGPMPNPKTNSGAQGPRSKRLDAPMPLSDFVKRGREATGVGVVDRSAGGTGMHHMHTGHGRRDQLSAGERTRILRMLRDEGGRLADEDSEVYIGAAPPSGPQNFDFDFDGPASMVMPPAPSPSQQQLRPDVPAKPAVVVGIAQAQHARRNKQASSAPAIPQSQPPQHEDAPLHLPDSPIPSRAPMTRTRSPSQHVVNDGEGRSISQRSRGDSVARPVNDGEGRSISQRSRGDSVAQNVPRSRPGDSVARQVNDGEGRSVVPRSRPPSQANDGEGRSVVSRSRNPSAAPKPARRAVPPPFSDDPTRQVDEQMLGLLRSGPGNLPTKDVSSLPGMTPRPQQPAAVPPSRQTPRKPPAPFSDHEATRMATVDPDSIGLRSVDTGELTPPVFDHDGDEATSVASVDAMKAMARRGRKAPPQPAGNDENTRAVNIRNDASISDVDWDLDE